MPWFTLVFQDVVTDNEFEKRLLSEVIPPSDIGVTFEDIGALENVKETLKELVMLPLQRPELFCKGQLTKVCTIEIVNCSINNYTHAWINGTNGVQISIYKLSTEKDNYANGCH